MEAVVKETGCNDAAWIHLHQDKWREKNVLDFWVMDAAPRSQLKQKLA
jgi:hypothetical protein